MNNVWIFQANPNKYRIGDSLRMEREERWNLNQHSTDIHKGDIVLIWISGPDAGIYAVGKVMTEPVSLSDSTSGIRYWLRRRQGLIVKPRVLVRYTKRLLNKPLLKVFLENDSALWGLSILRNPRGTNFSVTSDEWHAIQNWLDQ